MEKARRQKLLLLEILLFVRRQLKASRENIFSSLLWKQGSTAKNCCSCHQDVFYRNSAKCHACQGFCHQQCATTSAVDMSEEIDLLVICKQCCETQVAALVDSINESPTKPLLLQGQDAPNPVITKDGNLVCCKGSSASVGAGAFEHSPEVKSINRSAVTKKNTKSNWGLVWRKRNSEDTGFDFRLRNILLRGNTNRDLIKPLCRLCDQPYNADLMYIRCETCNHWFHADSVELDESKVFSVVGFKCCKCRRIKSPVCPYTQKKNVLKDKIENQQASKLKIPSVGFNRGMILDLLKGVPTASKLPRKAGVIHVSSANNPLLASPNDAKQCTEGKPEGNCGWKNANGSPGPRKLPVRRHVSQENDVLHHFQFKESSPSEANAISSTEEMPMRGSTKKDTNFATNLAEPNAAISVQDVLPSLLQQFTSNDCFGLETNIGGHVNGKEPPESVTKDKKNSPSVPRNGTPQVSDDQEKLITSKQIVVPCKYCSITEPWPNLCCQICGLCIHKTCSPWFESSSHEDGWRCGSCRDWC